VSAGAERTATLDVSRWSRPVWRRPGFALGAACAIALLPALAAFWVRIAPAPAPPAPEVSTPEPAPTLGALVRMTPDRSALGAITSGNLFTPGRTDWALAAAPDAGAEAPDAAAKRRAER
jgi:hypothetical protein